MIEFVFGLVLGIGFTAFAVMFQNKASLLYQCPHCGRNLVFKAYHKIPAACECEKPLDKRMLKYAE